MKNHPLNLYKFLAAICIATMWVALPLASAAGADIGPKPTMAFEFVYTDDLPNLLVMDGILLECEDSACVQAKPLEELGPQSFNCYGASCHATAYGFSEYHQLRLTFSDGITRESNIFTKNAFEATYKVTVRQNDLLVEEGRGYPNPVLYIVGLGILNVLLLMLAFITIVILIAKHGQARSWLIVGLVTSLILAAFGGLFNLALPLTLLIEILLATGYAFWRKRPLLTTLSLVALANVITQYGLWASLNALNTTHVLVVTIVLEIVIWGVEAVILYLPQRKEITFKEAALLSLALNAVSFAIGLALPV